MGNESSKSHNRSIPQLLKSGTSNSVVRKHLENAYKSRILQLKSCKLKSVPIELNQVNEILRNLDLSCNEIKELPAFLGSFSSLKLLHLSDNRIENVPDEIGLLKNLCVLNLAKNRLSSVPESFVGLQSLTSLNISSNKFTAIPTVVCQLNSLDELDCSFNFVVNLPPEMKALKISELNLNNNRLNSLGNLEQCEQLKMLRVEENCLDKESFSEALLRNSKVSLILHRGNPFMEKDFQNLRGYDKYQERFTAARRKM